MNDIDLVKQAVEQCGLPHNIAAFHRIRKLVEGQKPSTNSDYAAAQRVLAEFANSGGDINIHRFADWLALRLNPPKAADCA